MEYRQLGRSGLKVSALTLGTMTFGGKGRFSFVGNTDATSLSAGFLKMRAAGANGSIVINAGSTLSAATQFKLYADGSNGSITFQGASSPHGHSAPTSRGPSPPAPAFCFSTSRAGRRAVGGVAGASPTETR